MITPNNNYHLIDNYNRKYLPKFYQMYFTYNRYIIEQSKLNYFLEDYAVAFCVHSEEVMPYKGLKIDYCIDGLPTIIIFINKGSLISYITVETYFKTLIDNYREEIIFAHEYAHLFDSSRKSSTYNAMFYSSVDRPSRYINSDGEVFAYYIEFIYFIERSVSKFIGRNKFKDKFKTFNEFWDYYWNITHEDYKSSLTISNFSPSMFHSLCNNRNKKKIIKRVHKIYNEFYN